MADNYAIAKAGMAGISLTPTGVVLSRAEEAFHFADLCEMANMIPKGVTKAGAVLSIMAGTRLGMDPFQSIQSIAVVNGRPTLWGDALVGVVKASGLVEDERVEWFDSPDKKERRIACRYSIKRKGIETPFVGEFSKAMAQAAGLWGKVGPWTQYPQRMLLNRARAFAIRDGFADVIKGFRCYEEERDAVNVVDATADIVSTEGRDTPSAETVAVADKPKRRRASAAEAIASAKEAVVVDEPTVEQAEADMAQAEALNTQAAPAEQPVDNIEDFL